MCVCGGGLISTLSDRAGYRKLYHHGGRRRCRKHPAGSIRELHATHTHPCTPHHRKTLQVKIVDDEEYEKKDNFFIELGQPQWLKRGISGEGCWAGDGGSPPEVHLQGYEQELGRKVN